MTPTPSTTELIRECRETVQYSRAIRIKTADALNGVREQLLWRRHYVALLLIDSDDCPIAKGKTWESSSS
ncbi:hypothetical protein [Variovorax paradoxus]|uniref:Uncharacterized protein n=1 Tax=Variovorax paradoxus (strain EPS) TaxID=595537 RepID=E6V3U4_VARPE|nr:hypothetical protein [Variovorax paradoxus]ADU36968.1 hypothetical protein Varpa_2771 [Variovorax paradoxus EPS]